MFGVLYRLIAKKFDLVNKINTIIDKRIDSLLHPEIQIVTPFDVPQYASELSAGVDIQADLWNVKEKFLDNATILRDDNTGSITGICLNPGGQFLCPTGIHTAFEGIYEVQIRPRSGLALKKRITITNSPGTIEGDYKDEWGIILANEGKEPLIIKQGDKVAQAVFSLIVRPTFVRVDSVNDLTGSNRGGGFGHSDDKN